MNFVTGKTTNERFSKQQKGRARKNPLKGTGSESTNTIGTPYQYNHSSEAESDLSRNVLQYEDISKEIET